MIIRTQKVIFLLAHRSIWQYFKAGFKIYGWKKEKETLQRRGARSSSSHTSELLIARTHTQEQLHPKLFFFFPLRTCGRVERQAHYAAWDGLYHRLAFITLDLPQTPATCTAKIQSRPLSHRHQNAATAIFLDRG